MIIRRILATSKMECCAHGDVIYSPKQRTHEYSEEAEELTKLEKDLLRDAEKILVEDEEALEKFIVYLRVAEGTVARLKEAEIDDVKGRVAKAAVKRLKADVNVYTKRVKERKKRIEKLKKKGFVEGLEEWKKRIGDEFEEAVKEAARDECKGMGATPRLCEDTWFWHVDWVTEELDGTVVKRIDY